MAWYHRLFNALRSDRLSSEIEREIDFHIAERTDHLRASGLSEAEARRQAERQFGNRTTMRERTRDADVSEWIDSVMGDVRYAFRALRHSPAFTIVAIGSLALGIGANTTIFTLLDSLVLRPLPVVRPEELAQVSYSERAPQESFFTNPLWEQVRDRQDAFTAVAAFGDTRFNLANEGEAQPVTGAYVAGDYFAVFAVQPAVGRLFTRADDVRGCPGAAVLSYRFWERHYSASPDAIGKTITLTGQPFEIAGVTQASFRGPDVGKEADVYLPLCAEAIVRGTQSALDRRSTWWLQIIGRLKPGTDVRQAGVRLAAIAPASYAETVPPNWGAQEKKDYVTRSLFVHSATRGLSELRGQYSSALLALMGGVALVLLIACANVANLLLSRAEARQREVAIRLAMGAARRRLVRQLLTESVILAAAGAMVGLLAARVGTRALVGLIVSRNATYPVSLDLTLNGRLLAFTIAVTVLTVLVFGLLPAWRATRVKANAALKAQGRGVVEGHSRLTLGKTLVVAQIALSLVLVVSAGLLLATFRKLSQLNPGFAAHGVLLVELDPRRGALPKDQIATLHRTAVERVSAIPGVTSVATAEMTPVGGSTWNDEIVIDGFHPRSMTDAVTWFNEVSAGYFSTMETRLLAGRDFTAEDVPGSPGVAIVNDAWARKFFGNETAVGRQFRVHAGDHLGPPYTIVGVVENAKYKSLREDVQPIAYVAHSQVAAPGPITNLVLRVQGNPAAMIPALTKELTGLHSGMTLSFVPLERQLSASLQRERVLAVLSVLFGLVALSLAMLGLYGVQSYAVVRRRGELGVRLALGAARGRVVRMVLGDVITLVVAGVIIGGAGAMAASRLVRTFLYGVEPADPGVYLGTVVLLATVALAAGFIPAWRAARVDPLEALREQ